MLPRTRVVRLYVCIHARLSHSCTLLRPFDGMRCHSAGTLEWTQVTLCYTEAPGLPRDRGNLGRGIYPLTPMMQTPLPSLSLLLPLSLPPLFPSLPSLFPFPNTPFPSSLFPLLCLSPAAKRPPEIGKGYGGALSANAFWVNLEPRKHI